jgi:hypothetical protein
MEWCFLDQFRGTNTTIFNSNINSISIDKLGNVYAAGNFDSAIAKWNGISWIPLDANFVWTEIYALTNDSAGNIYAASDGAVYKWNGSNWYLVGCSNVSTIGSGYIYSIATDESGNIYAAGELTNANFNNYVAVSKTSIKIPTLNFFTPSTATGGTLVTISGTNLSGAFVVSFGGISASSLTALDSTTILAVLGSGNSGTVNVITPCGSASISGFTFNNSSNVKALSNGKLEGESNNIQMSPNPANTIVTLTTYFSKGEITINDLGGRQLLQIPIASTQTQLDISNLGKGVYVVSVLFDTQKLTGKLVVE